MTDTGIDPIGCAAFILLAFSLAGCAQAAWLASPSSRRCSWPLDFGATFRRRRLFGANKTVRGVVVMVPAAGVSFMIAAAALPPNGRWPLPVTTYGALGALAGLAFVAAELPNSFVKRQLDILPGEPARGRIARRAFLLADHLDSPCGAIAALALAVPVPTASIVYLLAFGSVAHVAFSTLTCRLGGKARAL